MPARLQNQFGTSGLDQYCQELFVTTLSPLIHCYTAPACKMTQQRPGQNQQQYGYPPQSVVDWRFVVNSGQYVDLTSPVPAPGQQWIHGQPHAARGTGSASHTVVAPQMMQVCTVV